MKKIKKSIKKIEIDGDIIKSGIDVIYNGAHFPVIYPEKIWQSYPQKQKEVLLDNVVYNSTIFLPQIIDLPKIEYKTGRPIAETFLFKNGIYDMPICALADKKSSLDYVKMFFNTVYNFKDNDIKILPVSNKKFNKKTAIIPFSFGKETLLSLALAKEIGLNVILVNFIEPSYKYERLHKKKLISSFEKKFKIKVYTVENKPGILRCGYHWNLKTELGWGLQTTEYALLSLPFVHHFKADYIILGNEQTYNDDDSTFFDKEGVFTYRAAYDQNSNWTPQQGLLCSMILGRIIEVVSLVEPLYEIANTKILHSRYKELASYQMSCFASSDQAKNNRWCESCIKCGYMYALCSALNLDLKSIGFRGNLFDQKHSKIYDYFFDYNHSKPQHGSVKELGLAFYLSYLNGCQGYSIDKFKRKFLNKFKRNKGKYIKKYFGINSTKNVPAIFKNKILNIYQQELSDFRK